MSYFRVYINPKDDLGQFTGYQEVTSDVDSRSIANITEQIDNDEYNVGVLKFNSFKVSLRNDHGQYSDVETVESIFRERRGGSKIKLTWQVQDYQSICGCAIAGKAKITPEVQVFEGIINDDATRLSVDSQMITFQVIGFESIFDENETPFASLSNGDLFSEALLTVLDQAGITKYLTVSASNINVDLDVIIDDVSDFENTTVKEALDSLLFGANSVLYIKSSTIYVASRDGQGTSQRTFYGQASNNGIEDIIKISSISAGRNRVFNYWTWDETTLLSQNATSIEDNGLRKKAVSFSMITNNTKRQTMLDQYKNEFSELKQEFKITVVADYDSLALGLLDIVKVDYPTPLIPGDINGVLPLYGIAIYGESLYPLGSYSMVIGTDQSFKILGKSLNTKTQVLTLTLKEE